MFSVRRFLSTLPRGNSCSVVRANLAVEASQKLSEEEVISMMS